MLERPESDIRTANREIYLISTFRRSYEYWTEVPGRWLEMIIRACFTEGCEKCLHWTLCKLKMLNGFARKIQRKSLSLLNTTKMVLVYCSPSQNFLEVQCVFQWRHFNLLPQTNYPHPSRAAGNTVHSLWSNLLELFLCFYIPWMSAKNLQGSKFPKFSWDWQFQCLSQYYKVPFCDIQKYHFTANQRDCAFVLALVDLQNTWL